MAIGLFHELRLEGDHPDETVDCHKVSEDHQREDAVLEESPQGRNKVWITRKMDMITFLDRFFLFQFKEAEMCFQKS